MRGRTGAPPSLSPLTHPLSLLRWPFLYPSLLRSVTFILFRNCDGVFCSCPSGSRPGKAHHRNHLLLRKPDYSAGIVPLLFQVPAQLSAPCLSPVGTHRSPSTAYNKRSYGRGGVPSLGCPSRLSASPSLQPSLRSTFMCLVLPQDHELPRDMDSALSLCISKA